MSDHAGRIAAIVVAIVVSSCGTGGPTRPTGFTRAPVGVIFVGQHDDLGYNQAAWEGTEALARAFPDNLVLRTENVPETAQAEVAMEDLIRRGARIIFATSFGHLPFAYAVAKRHPDVIVLHQGGFEPEPRLPNLGTYWGTVYERVYEAGIVAGRATRTNTLGYVVAFPIPATFNNLNAFALGARSVNPRATVRMEFTSDWCAPDRQRAAAARLLAAGADVLTQHQDCTGTILRAAEAAGVASIGYHYDGSEVAPRGWLVGSAWAWGPLFIDIMRTIVRGSFASSPYTGDFLGGARTDDDPSILTEFAPRVDARTRALVAAAERRFVDGASPFDGPLADRDGTIRVPRGVSPSYREALKMDYLVEGVVGAIPSP